MKLHNQKLNYETQEFIENLPTFEFYKCSFCQQRAGKIQVTYTRFLTLLKQVIQSHEVQLQSTTIFLDLEVAVHNAAYKIFPELIG